MQYTLNENAHVSIVILNQEGKLVDKLTDEFQLGGQYEIKWIADGLTAGTYYCIIKAGSDVLSNVIIKVD